MPSSSLAFSSATWIWLTHGSSIGVEKIDATLSLSAASADCDAEPGSGEAAGDRQAEKAAAIESETAQRAGQ